MTDEKREGRCELCSREYRVWVAASPLWNAVVRGGCINGEEQFNYLCAGCFMGLAEDMGVASFFCLTAVYSTDLQTVSPSGRVWDEEQFLWV